MKQVDRRVKKRRDERIRSLQQHHSSWPAPRDYAGGAVRSLSPSPRQLTSRERLQKRRTKLTVQVLFACLLLAFTYVVFQSDTPTAIQAQAFITEVMERDFNFQGVSDWYEANLGGISAIIPTFSKSDDGTKNSLQPTTWSLPVQGQVISSYTDEHPYVTLGGSGEGKVGASAEGLVSFVGEKEGWGHCVIVQHAGDMETWYGSLSDVQVEQSNWVERGNLLGLATALDGTVQFGIKRGGQFVNPLDVMNID